MSIHVAWHIPDSFDVDRPDPVVVTDTTALLSLDRVKGWTTMEGFHRFVKSENLLMAELHEGREWWVIARTAGDPLDLPAWERLK